MFLAFFAFSRSCFRLYTLLLYAGKLRVTWVQNRSLKFDLKNDNWKVKWLKVKRFRGESMYLAKNKKKQMAGRVQ